MNESKARGQLGRGLSALLGESAAAEAAAASTPGDSNEVLVGQLHPSPFQPRRSFAEEEIAGLADSIRERGILQPILVRRDPGKADSYEIVAGERRWRAAQVARLHEVPVIIKDLNDDGVLEIALVENIQRQNLNPLEEAAGYRRLIDEFSHTQEGLAQTVGKSRSHIANILRLLNLPDKIKDMLEQGLLTAGHARALLNADDPVPLARKVIKRGLNVRQTEKLVQKAKIPRTPQPKDVVRDPDTEALERGLTNLLGLKVTIAFDGKGGRMTIQYSTLDQLDDIIQRLGHVPAFVNLTR